MASFVQNEDGSYSVVDDESVGDGWTAQDTSNNFDNQLFSDLTNQTDFSTSDGASWVQDENGNFTLVDNGTLGSGLNGVSGNDLATWLDSAGGVGDISTGGLGQLGNIAKRFMGSDAGKALLSALQLGGVGAALSGAGQNKPASTQYTPLEKFALAGSYNPVDMGYEQTYRPTKWTGDELNSAKSFFSSSPDANTIYNTANKLKLDRNQLADVYTQAMGGGFGAAKDTINNYLQQTGNTLNGGFVPSGDSANTYRAPSSTSNPKLRTLYAEGGDIETMGMSGGQDDDVPIMASAGEYVLDAETVSALGDGNTAAGVAKLDQLRENLRKHKRQGALSQIAPKALPIERYMGGEV